MYESEVDMIVEMAKSREDRSTEALPPRPLRHWVSKTELGIEDDGLDWS